MGEFGAVFIISIFLQTVKRLSAFNAGLTFLPMAISVFIFAPVAGVLATRFGPKWVVTTGMTLEAIALFSLSQIISVDNPVYYLYPILVIYGAGVGLAISQLTSTVLMSIPWQKAGVGSGATNTVRQIGSAFGIAFFFQAEDGIRYLIVTGVQTCALPISSRRRCVASPGPRSPGARAPGPPAAG